MQCFLYVLDKSLTKPPTPLGTKCSEGPAVSRKRHAHRLDARRRAVPRRDAARARSRIYEADIVYDGGIPKLANRRLVLDSRDLPFRCTLECQNFRPPGETELTFSAYGHQGTDVCGVDLETKKVVNYSDAPDQYDEPEGISPDGRWTLVECDRESFSGKGAGHVDIWKLSLDGTQDLGTADLLQQVPGLQGVEPGRQRRRPVHGVPDGEVARPGRRRLRHLPLRLRQARRRALNLHLGAACGSGFGDPLLVLDVRRCWLRSQLTQSCVQLEGSFSFCRTPKSWSPVA